MRFRNRILSLSLSLSLLRLQLETLQIHCRFKLKKRYNSVNTEQFFQLVFFILHLWFPLKSTFYLEISRFTFTISGTVYHTLQFTLNVERIVNWIMEI